MKKPIIIAVSVIAAIIILVGAFFGIKGFLGNKAPDNTGDYSFTDETLDKMAEAVGQSRTEVENVINGELTDADKELMNQWEAADPRPQIVSEKDDGDGDDYTILGVDADGNEYNITIDKDAATMTEEEYNNRETLDDRLEDIYNQAHQEDDEDNEIDWSLMTPTDDVYDGNETYEDTSKEKPPAQIGAIYDEGDGTGGVQDVSDDIGVDPDLENMPMPGVTVEG